jgi:hypothetical protein
MSAGDFTEPIELVPFAIRGGLGEPIRDLTMPMLNPDPTRRPAAAELLPRRQDMFLEAATRAHALDGRVV